MQTATAIENARNAIASLRDPASAHGTALTHLYVDTHKVVGDVFRAVEFVMETSQESSWRKRSEAAAHLSEPTSEVGSGDVMNAREFANTALDTALRAASAAHEANKVLAAVMKEGRSWTAQLAREATFAADRTFLAAAQANIQAADSAFLTAEIIGKVDADAASGDVVALRKAYAALTVYEAAQKAFEAATSAGQMAIATQEAALKVAERIDEYYRRDKPGPETG